MIHFGKSVSFSPLSLHQFAPLPSKYTFPHFQGCTVPRCRSCHRTRPLSTWYPSWSQERQSYLSSTAITPKMLDFSTISEYIAPKNPTHRSALPRFRKRRQTAAGNFRISRTHTKCFSKLFFCIHTYIAFFEIFISQMENFMLQYVTRDKRNSSYSYFIYSHTGCAERSRIVRKKKERKLSE